MKTRNLLLGLAVVLGLLSVIVSCTIENLQIASASDGEIVLSIPATESVEVRSTPTSSECYIYNAAVLVMSGGTISQAEYITSISDNGTQSPKLRFVNISPSSGETIHVICNFDSSVTAETISALASGSKTLSDAQDAIAGKAAYTSGDSNTTGELDTPLLMYGSGTYGGATLNMTFQVAKVSVEIEENSKAATLGLDIESFFSVASAPNTTWGTSSSENRQNSDGKHKISTDDADGWIYLYESGKADNYPYTSLNSIVLVVTNPDSQVEDGVSAAGGTGYICLTYDTMNNGAVSQYNTFERGKHYNFKITNIYTRGYDTPEEALNNPGNVEYEVEVADDWSTDYQYNGQYALETVVDTAYMYFPTLTSTNLVRFGAALASSGQSQNINAEISLVRVSNGAFVPVDNTEVILYDAAGRPADDNNVLTLKGVTIPEEGYMLQYTTGDNFVEGMYLRIKYGNLEEFITVGSLSFTAENNFSIDSDGGSAQINVSSQIWWPNKDAANFTDYTFTFVDSEGNTVEVDWVDIDSDGNITVDAQVEQATQFGTAVSGFDLSTNNGDWDITTANCYIVNAPGTYKFPLVYGNAYKDGAVNTSAYTTDGAPMIMVREFVDHSGTTIISPYIETQTNTTLTDSNQAILVWQDVQNLVDDSSLYFSYENGMRYLNFTVTDPISSEGNAVLAVTDSEGTIMWSWHIWVTGYDPYDESEGTQSVTSWNNVTYQLMDRYLGACTKYDTPARSAIVKVTPSSDAQNNGMTIVITQEGLMEVGDNCYYQSGRKDPIVGITGGASGKNKTTYGTYPWEPYTEAVQDRFADGNIMTTTDRYMQIQYPYKIIWGGNSTDSTYSEYDFNGYNLWNSTRTVSDLNNSPFDYTTVVKTIYDPCPPGFSLPPNDFFSAFYTYSIYSSMLGTTNHDAIINSNSGAYSSSQTTYPVVLRDVATDIYNLFLVPYRYAATAGARGRIYDQNPFSMFTASPMRNTSYYHYGSILATISDDDSTWTFNPSGAMIRGNARCVLPIKEMDSSISAYSATTNSKKKRPTHRSEAGYVEK